MDPSEPRWRANSSFSPTSSRRWDCRYQSDGLSLETPGDPLHGSSLSSYSKESRSVMSIDEANHQHSVSDGALSYLESPSNNLHTSRWTPHVPRFDLDGFSTNGGARINSLSSPLSSDRQFTPQISPLPRTLFSPPIAESSRWASSSKHPAFPPPRNFPGRRSFMSTPVYPLAFRNLVSEGDSSGNASTSTSHKLVPSDHPRNHPPWLENALNPDVKLHKTLSDFPKYGIYSDANANLMRERSQWSTGSSFDYDGDSIEVMEHISADHYPKSPNCSLRYQKCGLCHRMLFQKSPWSLQRIVRSLDLPVAGILSCGHVFHADCLEETTPKTLLHEPPCPLCLNLVTHEGSASISEPLLHRLKPTPHLSRGVGTDLNFAGNDVDLGRNRSQPSRGTSSVRNRLRKRLSFRGKISKELFGAKMVKKM